MGCSEEKEVPSSSKKAKPNVVLSSGALDAADPSNVIGASARYQAKD